MCAKFIKTETERASEGGEAVRVLECRKCAIYSFVFSSLFFI